MTKICFSPFDFQQKGKFGEMSVHTRGIQPGKRKGLSNIKIKDKQELGETRIKGGGLDDAIGSLGGPVQI